MDNYHCKTRQSKIWLTDLQLKQSDRDILLSVTGWLTDTIIDAAQILLAQQFPNISGLQSVALGLTMAFNIQTGEFVQILNTSRSHWLTVTTIGVKHQATIKVYDSMYDCLPRMAQAQVASILCTQQSIIKVEMMDVKKQVRIIESVIHVH